MGGACCTSDGALANFAKSHLDERFGIGTADALQRLSELLTRVELKLMGARKLSHPFLINLGMILRQVEKDRRNAQPITSSVPFEDVKVLRKGARYARYAAAAYLNDKKAIAGHIGGLQAEDIKIVSPDNVIMCPGFFIAVDQQTDDIVLCIRGPNGGAPEALSEAVAPKEPLLGGRASASLLESARNIREAAGKTLMRLSQESPRKSIAIVGHSTAGGVASLATILLCADGCPFAKLMATGKVKCYSFAPPPTFEPLWALPAWVHGSTHSFVYGMDCVPRACSGTLSKLYMALKKVDELPLSAERRLAYIRGECELDTVLPDYMDLPQGLSGLETSLFIVGTIITLYPGEAGRVLCEAAAPHMMDRLLLHPDMVHQHSAECLEKAFEDLGNQAGVGDGCVMS